MQVFSPSPAAVYSGMGNAITRISSTEGARALWRGVASVIVGAGPAHAVYFGTYELVKEWAGGNRAGHQFGAIGESLRQPVYDYRHLLCVMS
jgi:solute carrier family 25 iron transporter 28/37